MEILFTGATGVLGRAALPRLVAEGHRVSAAFRSDADAVWLEEVGSRPTELDLFDAGAVEAAVRGVDTVVHYATAIPRLVDMSNRESWVVNDRLRDTATGLLVDAALANEVERSSGSRSPSYTPMAVKHGSTRLRPWLRRRTSSNQC
jgi:nucleoside-diphosphate-sugar epimerase